MSPITITLLIVLLPLVLLAVFGFYLWQNRRLEPHHCSACGVYSTGGVDCLRADCPMRFVTNSFK